MYPPTFTPKYQIGCPAPEVVQDDSIYVSFSLAPRFPQVWVLWWLTSIGILVCAGGRGAFWVEDHGCGVPEILYNC